MIKARDAFAPEGGRIKAFRTLKPNYRLLPPKSRSFYDIPSRVHRIKILVKSLFCLQTMPTLSPFDKKHPPESIGRPEK